MIINENMVTVKLLTFFSLLLIYKYVSYILYSLSFN